MSNTQKCGIIYKESLLLKLKTKMESTENLVELRKINLTYNRGKDNAFQSLYDVDVNIKQGEFVVILGPSGCGKSSLLNIIAGLEAPDEGTVFINGEDVLRMKPSERTEFHRRKIGMVFQSYNLISTLSVLNNVALPQIFINAKKRDRDKKAMALLERFGIQNQWKRIPSQLSGGQQQRIGIARAIINDPPLILADEPVGNLDSESANNVMQIMSELNQIEKKTILLVTHNPENVEWGTHIIYMKDGRITKEEFKDSRGVSQEVQSPVEEGKSEFDRIIEKFRGLSEKQIRFLMEPLKAKLITESFLLPYDEQQIKSIENSIKMKISGNYDTSKFFDQLDRSSEKGGAGLDERIARKISKELEDLITISERVFGNFSSKDKAIMITNYLTKNKGIRIKIDKITKITDLIEKRITEDISHNLFKTTLDLPEYAGGIGLDKRTVKKILREIDLILIVGFGFNLNENSGISDKKNEETKNENILKQI